jgi:hypothetical protein
MPPTDAEKSGFSVFGRDGVERAGPSRGLLVLAAIAVAAAAMFIVSILRGPTATPGSQGERTGSLALRVETSNGQLLLSWNAHSSAITSASQGSLTIADGDHKEVVDLDLAVLRNGSVVYSSITRNVDFRLEVVDKRGTRQAESVRFPPTAQ